jgi:hypothetical protein
MFKKTLIALSMVAASGTVVAASTSTVTVSGATAVGTTVSAQGYASTETVDFDQANAIVYTVQANASETATYQNSTKNVLISLENATINPAGSPTVYWFSLSDSTSSAVQTSGISYPTASSILVTPTAQLSGAKSIVSGSKMAIYGLKLNASGVASGSTISAKIDFNSSIPGATVATATGTAATFISEYYASVTGLFDAKVDVAADRKAYESGASDVAAVTITDLAAQQHDTTPAYSYTWNGDFEFLDDDGDGKFESTEGTINGQVSGSSVALTYNGSIASSGYVSSVSSAISVAPSTAATKRVITAPQEFSVDVVVSYADAAGKAKKLTLLDGAKAGSWSLNGDTTVMPFLPFGSDYAHSISVTNASAADGEISITLMADGKSYDKTLDTKAAAKSVVNIGKEVSAFAAENKLTGAQLTIVTNAKSVSVTGIYYSKADGDRVLVNND